MSATKAGRRSLARMQAAMTKTLDELLKKPANCPVASRQEVVTLASIVEKETGKASERRMVAGVYCNRLRIGMKLDADPTVIYPITKGKPLGRRIKRSELMAVTGYNTYREPGLPMGPIANPGKESIAAVLNPEQTKALYFVADGTGGHVFADTLPAASGQCAALVCDPPPARRDVASRSALPSGRSQLAGPGRHSPTPSQGYRRAG